MTNSRPAPKPSLGRLRRRRAARGKAAILDRAAAVVAELGADRARFADVSEATGVAISTLQYSFGNRDDLILATLAHAAEAEVDRIRGTVEAAGRNRREALVGACLDETGLRAARLRIEYWRLATRDPEVAEEWADVRDGWEALIGAALDLDEPAARRLAAQLDGVARACVLAGDDERASLVAEALRQG